MRKLISIGLIFVLTIAAITYGASILIFFDFLSIFVVGVIFIGGLLLSMPLGKTFDAFVVALGSADLPEDRGLAAYDVFHRLSKLSVGAGVLGVVVGLILMLQHMDDPTAIGPAMAIALLTYLYSLFLGEVFFRTFAADALARTQGASLGESSPPPAAEGWNEGVLSLVRKAVGAVILLACLILALLMKSSLAAFVDVPSAILVGGFVLFGAIASFRFTDLITAVVTQFSFERLAENDAIISHLVFRRLAELGVGGGIIGTVIGLVQMLQKLDDPTAVGPAMAVALGTTFYGFILSELFFRPLAADALARGNVTRDVGQRGQEWRLMGILGGLFMLLLVFFIMLICMCDFSP